jgi:hypothetical protein
VRAVLNIDGANLAENPVMSTDSKIDLLYSILNKPNFSKVAEDWL